MSTALTHIALHVKDLEASLAFYQSYGLMEDISPLEEQKSRWLASPNDDEAADRVAIVLVAGAEEQSFKPTNTTRLGFSVSDKQTLREIYARAVNDGKVVQAYEESADGQRATFRMTDPSGYVVEFWTAENVQEGINFKNITLHVKDMEESREFYEKWTDLDLIGYGKVSKSLRMGNGDQDNPFHVVFCDCAAEEAEHQENNITHLGFAARTIDDLKALYKRAQDEDAVHIDWVEMEPPVGTLFMLSDLDGNLVEYSYGQPLGEFKDEYESDEAHKGAEHKGRGQWQPK